MTLDEIQKMSDRDLKVHSTKLYKISMDVPNLHNKYYKLFSKERLSFKKLEGEYDQLFREKYHYYMIDYQYTLDKKEVLIYIAGDVNIIKKKNQMEFSKEKLRALEGIIDNINRISFNIRNAIEFLKWTHGQN